MKINICANRILRLLISFCTVVQLVQGAQAGETASGLDEQGQLSAVVSSAKDGFSYQRLENGIQLRVGGVSKNIIFYGPEIVRVNANLGQPHTTQPSLVVDA